MLFLLFSVCAFNLIAFLMPKHLTRIEMYASALFATLLDVFTDKFLDLKYDLYGYFAPGLEWQTLIAVLGLYPAINIIFLDFYPYCKSLINKVVYVLCWVLFSICFEWLSLKSGFFYYHGWQIWYSAICYPFIFFILAWNLTLIRKFKKADT